MIYKKLIDINKQQHVTVNLILARVTYCNTKLVFSVIGLLQIKQILLASFHFI
jgi:hypothetical protein